MRFKWFNWLLYLYYVCVHHMYQLSVISVYVYSNVHFILMNYSFNKYILRTYYMPGTVLFNLLLSSF